MLSRLLRPSKAVSRGFSSLATQHKKTHIPQVMDSKFYEKDFMATSIEEIEFIRSPLYDLAKVMSMDEEEAHDLLDDLGLKTAMIDPLTESVLSPQVSPDTAAFFRYQDKVSAPEDQ